MDRILNSWLPNGVSREMHAEEPRRFEAAVEGLKHAVENASSASEPDRWHGTLVWIQPVHRFLQCKLELPIDTVTALVSTLSTLVLASSEDIEVQVRWSEVLCDALHTYRKQLVLAIPWRPWYNLIRSHVYNTLPKLQGMYLDQARHSAMFEVAAHVRRHFTASAFEEVWAEFRSSLLGNGTDMDEYQALGWLALLLPSRKLPTLQGAAVTTILGEWLDAWDRVPHCSFWNNHWMYLFKRFAKDDTTGVVDWSTMLPRLLTHVLWSFEVPVGTASARVPVSRHAPYKAHYLFSGKDVMGRSAQRDSGGGQVGDRTSSAAVLLVHLLRHDQGGVAISSVQALTQLLEQYFHPSNGGNWTQQLSAFLRRAVVAFTRHLARQGGESGDAMRGIPPDSQVKFVQCVVQLADRAQFAKDNGLSSSAMRALANVAFVCPELVLPLVVQRFQSALENDVAAHTLATAIHTLALCVRPLLLSGWGLPDEPGPQLLAEAMMAVLPGIDANDEYKTTAVLQLYTAVLSSVPLLGHDVDAPAGCEGGVRLPLYAGEWCEEVLLRIFALLQNLDTAPGMQGDATPSKFDMMIKASFLLKGGSVYCHFLEHMFRRMPREALSSCVSHVRSFLLDNTLPGVAMEGGALLRAALAGAPHLTSERVVRPLIARIKEELTHVESADISKNTEAVLTWHMIVLSQALGEMSHDHLLSLLPELEAVVDAAMRAPQRAVLHHAAGLIGEVCMGLVSEWLDDGPPQPLTPSGVLQWVDKHGVGLTPPRWVEPCEAHLAAAERLLDKYLLGAAQRLEELCAAGEANSSSKWDVASQLFQVLGTLIGLVSRLRDFDFAAALGGEQRGTPLSVVGCAGPPVGPLATRERVAAVLVTAAKWLSSAEREALEALLGAALLLLCNGTLEHLGAQQLRGYSGPGGSVPGLTLQPGAAAHLMGEGSAWVKRVPLWVALDRVKGHSAWRSGAHAFLAWSSSAAPQVVSAAQLPPAYLQLLGEVVRLSMHPLAGVRQAGCTIVTAAIKRFPCLVRAVLPQYLAALADVSAPPFSTSDTDLALVVADVRAAASSLAGGLTVPSASSTEPEREGRAQGACLAINMCIYIWRHVVRDPDSFAMMLRALMATWRHNSVSSQKSIAGLLLHMSMRFKHPERLDLSSPLFAELAEDFLSWSAEAAPAAGWRYALLASVYSALLAPPVCHPGAARFTRHLLKQHASDVLLLRNVAAAGLLCQLVALVQHAQSNAEVERLLAEVVSAPGYGPALLRHMSLGHAALDASEQAKDKRGGGSAAQVMSRMMQQTFKGMVAGTISQTMDRHDHWPEARGAKLAGLSEGMFEVPHARLVRLLAAAVPGGALSAALRCALEESVVALEAPRGGAALSGANVGVESLERAAQCTVAEVLAGLLASGTPFRQGAQEEAQWVTQLLRRCLCAATVDGIDSWCIAIRYALSYLLRAALRPDTRSAALAPQAALRGVKAVLFSLLAVPGSASGGALLAEVRRLRYLRSAVAALCQEGRRGARGLPAEVRTFWGAVLDELSALLAGDQHSLREHVGAVLADSLAYLIADGDGDEDADMADATERGSGGDDGGSSNGNGYELVAPLMEVGDVLPHGATGAAGSGHSTPTDVEMVDGEPLVLVLHSGPSHLTRLARDLADSLAAGFLASAEVLQQSKEAATEGGGVAATPSGAVPDVQDADLVLVAQPGGPGARTPASLAHAVAQVGYGVELLRAAMRSADMVALSGLLLRLLPGLLQLQELALPQLQAAALEAKTAFALLKYLPLSSAQLSAVLSTLRGAAGSDFMSTRAAALVHLQYVWFRHFFLLSPADTAAAKDLVMQRLRDPKTEVRDIAAATLSGMVKGLSQHDVDSIRSALLARAVELFGVVGTRRAAVKDEARNADKVACIQGLKALVMSSPYDVPAWLAEVLMALVRAATDPAAALRTDASRTLSEFKRTHEQDSKQQLRGLLDEDQWNAYQQVTSHASYFA